MVSIIIPTYNEADQIANTISVVKQIAGENDYEIIVVDGGSNDDTVSIANAESVTTFFNIKKGRAAQMNYGAAKANAGVLYFLHADSIPPNNFLQYIYNALDKGFSSGCFRLKFDYSHWFLKANAWFTRFNINTVRFGDQSLFVKKEVFQKAGGFKENLLMMEDQEIIHRIKKYGKFKVMNEAITTSARKYLDNGIYRMQGIFYRIWAMYYLGYTQEQMLRVHKRLIRKHKL